MILRTLVVFVTALCFLLFLGSHALLRQENTGFKNGNGPSAKRDIVEQIRILRSKPAHDGSASKYTKKKKKSKSKSMKEKQTKDPKGAKSVKGGFSLSASDTSSEDEYTSSDDHDHDDSSEEEEDGGDNGPGAGASSDDSFDISDCNSYSNDWLLELSDYCGTDLEDLSGCQCPTARGMLASGKLTCAQRHEKDSSPPACPKSCPVCEFCMVVEGCEDIYD